MDHKPVLHYRVLQLGLPLMLFLLTDPLNGYGIGHGRFSPNKLMKELGEKLGGQLGGKPSDNFLTTNWERSSCEGGLYLAGVDSFRFEQKIGLPERVPKSTAQIYIGNKTLPKDFLYCNLTLGRYHCPEVKMEPGCYCTYHHSALIGDVFVVAVQIPLILYMSNQSLYLWYEPSGHPVHAITLLVQPLPEMMDGTVNLTLSVDGTSLPISNMVCPKFTLKLKENYTVIFCAWYTQNPTVVMHFDNRKHFEFNDTCGKQTVSLSADHLGETFWFSYKDSCRRHGTLHCRYPAIAGASSVQMTKGLLGLLVLGYLMTYNTWS